MNLENKKSDKDAGTITENKKPGKEVIILLVYLRI